MPGDTLELDITYYWRVKFFDQYDVGSDWSASRSFTTVASLANRPPAPPVLSSPADGATDVTGIDEVSCLVSVAIDDQVFATSETFEKPGNHSGLMVGI